MAGAVENLKGVVLDLPHLMQVVSFVVAQKLKLHAAKAGGVCA
jgi:hypothetical protein